MILSNKKEPLSEFETTMEGRGFHIVWAETGEAALSMITKEKCNLLITDESLRDMTGIELVRKVVPICPMLNCAVASSLSSSDFHEATEWLGVKIPILPRDG